MKKKENRVFAPKTNPDDDDAAWVRHLFDTAKEQGYDIDNPSKENYEAVNKKNAEKKSGGKDNPYRAETKRMIEAEKKRKAAKK